MTNKTFFWSLSSTKPAYTTTDDARIKPKTVVLLLQLCPTAVAAHKEKTEH